MNGTAGMLGVAVLLAWLSLPLLAFVAAHRAEEPSSRQRALTLALVLAAALIAVPWLRVWTHHATALCFSKQTITAALAFAPSQFLLERAAAPSLWAMLGVAGGISILIGAIRTIIAAVKLRALLSRAARAPQHLRARAARIAAEMDLPAPEVRVSAEASIPFVTGWRPRTIVLPGEILHILGEEELDLVLVHELVHVKRRDVELAWLVMLARIPFVLHPVSRWIANEISLAREQAVDAIVAGDDPCAYARVLVDVAAHAGGKPCPAPVAMSCSALERRIARLVTRETTRPSRLRTVIGVAAAVIALAMIAPLRAESTPDRRTELIRCIDEVAPEAPVAPPVQDCAEELACELDTCESCVE